MTAIVNLRFCLTMLLLFGGFLADAGEPVLWYTKPASTQPWKNVHRSKDWRQRCLPIGNGSLGGMIFGNPDKERIQVNEDSFWIGDEDAVGNSMTFADLYIQMDHHEHGSYRRELDLSQAVHTITYQHSGIAYEREYFSSYPDKVMVLHLSADHKGAHTGTIFLDDVYEDSTAEVVGNRIILKGDNAGASPLPVSLDNDRTIAKHSLRKRESKKRFDIRLARETQVRVLHRGGSIKAADGKITFHGVDELTVLIAAGTDFLNQRKKGWRGAHPHKRITADLDRASKKSYRELLASHVADYRKLFDRFAIDLGTTDAKLRALPTDRRLKAREAGARDPELEALLFQYARYLMISCSRPGTLPSHLQGIWNRSTRPAWWGDFHTDVNIQMCYWFTDKANLSECYEPYVTWLNSIREVRTEKTRSKFNTRGWTFGAMNNPYGGSSYFNVKGVAAWCAQNLWDHYAFTRDKEMLRDRIFPIMQEMCWFWEDNLKELPDGSLVSTDGFSPEHGPKHVDGVTFDQVLIWDLFTNTIEAAHDLGIAGEWIKALRRKREKLLKPRIGRWGQLQEWMEDIDDPNNKHRHLSHLIALHPGRQIAPDRTPKLAAAARVSLDARGEGRSAWAKIWRSIMWARLHDAERAYHLLDLKIRKGHFNANLFSSHDPGKAFQIDGNFGYGEAVSEMLVQSHLGKIHLLPALPEAWPQGSVRGMRVRGGFELDLQWQQGKLTRAVVRGVSNDTDTCVVQYGNVEKTFKVRKGEETTVTPGSLP